MMQGITNEYVLHTHLHVLLLDIYSDESLVVDFPGSACWKGILSEMEAVTDDDECGKYTEKDLDFCHLSSSWPANI